MTDHHSYRKEYIGESDIAALVVVSCTQFGGVSANILKFGEDHAYTAYIVDGDCDPISDGYDAEIFRGGRGWFKIYDDHGLAYHNVFEHGLMIARRGELGCIIQIR